MGETNSSSSTTKHTFCRICEPACGLVATVEEGQILEVKPDREHPISRGYACHKGIAMLDIHRDPDRLNAPLRRVGDAFEPASWDAAADDIAARITKIRDQYGPQALGLYVGNPLGFNALGNMSVGSLFAQLPGFRFFSAGTQDCANKFAASEAVFGSRVVHPLPDIEHADVILVIGANPRVSQGSFISLANMTQRLREARVRGAAVHFVNPYRVETPEDGVGDTLQIRPDTDLYFLAGLLHELDRLEAWDDSVLAAHATNVEELRRFVARYPVERAAEVCGVEASVLSDLAASMVGAKTAVYASTGLNMGRQGTLAYTLVHALSMVTGNLDRVGGNISSIGFYPNARSGKATYETGFADTEYGTLRHRTLPGNLLSEYILDVDEPIKALVVVAGNPLLSIAGEARLRKAFANLELLIVVDLYANATAEYAHWALPATDQFEREDLTVVNLGLQYEPWVQFAERVVEPTAERREEWWIFARIAQAMGLSSVLDGGGAADYWAKYDHMLKGSNLSLDELRATDNGVIVLPGLHTGKMYTDIVQRPDGRVDLWPAAYGDAPDQAEDICVELLAEGPEQLKLISRRDTWMHNSWMHNVEGMHRRGRDKNPVYVHPTDAERLGFVEGDQVRMVNNYGELDLTVELDERLRPGVVAVVHGWGHQGAPGMSEARRAAGVNVNILLPSGPESFDRLSSQAHMTGVAVSLQAV